MKAMNERAKKLGCTGTVFENPHGLDFDEWAGDMHSTAHDVALMMQGGHEKRHDPRGRSERGFLDRGHGADGTDHSHSMDTHNYLLGKMATSVARPAPPTTRATALRVPTTAMATRSTPSF